ncbi:polygalacturonase [Pannonibacter phragmitetus]|uniref:polygalacturonase PglB n=1 Tax=Pannonibacter phragmitetus TaxID=121719 RepID=UPI00067C998D|nr:glycoside hydrolase family 28 protein [Pannonibacter phragmitetus]KND16252.1 polygalacturonase [Pannonibacter phragmitetus]
MSLPRRVHVEAKPGDRSPFLQSVIDADAAPLHLVLEPGIHRSGGLRLRSNVTLELAKGAELHFIPDYEAYAGNSVSVVAEESDRGMLVASGASNIAITGAGRIFGDGAGAFIVGEDADMGTLRAQKLRPRVIVLEDCRDVRIEGISIEDAPLWTMHLVGCENVHVEGVFVDNNRRMPNTDGIVIDGCRNVLIVRSEFRTADDGIVLKTTRRPDGSLKGACENITARDCLIESHSCALKIGTESFAPFRNISFEDIRIEKSNRGLGIFSRDGGLVDGVRFARITLDCHETPAGFWGSGEAVTINTIERRPEEGPAGRVTNITIEDVSGSMEGAINLVAEHPGGISGVVLRRVALRQLPGRFGTGLAYDIRPTPADRFDRFEEENATGRVNAWRFGPDGKIIGLIDYPGGMPAVFAKDIEGLVMEDVTIDRPEALPQGWNAQAVVLV